MAQSRPNGHPLLRLWRDQSGAAAVEYALVFTLVLLLTLGTIEIALVLWQWNSGEKATQAGVRYAAVHDLAAPGLRLVGSAPTAPGNYGDWCRDRTTSAVNADCWFTPVTCNSTGCSGGYGYDGTAFTAVVNRMRQMFPLVQPANVEVVYSFSGLGFIGRPGGQPMMVTVRLRDMSYRLFVLDALTSLPAVLAMPGFAATLVGEDMSNTIP